MHQKRPPIPLSVSMSPLPNGRCQLACARMPDLGSLKRRAAMTPPTGDSAEAAASGLTVRHWLPGRCFDDSRPAGGVVAAGSNTSDRDGGLQLTHEATRTVWWLRMCGRASHPPTSCWPLRARCLMLSRLWASPFKFQPHADFPPHFPLPCFLFSRLPQKGKKETLFTSKPGAGAALYNVSSVERLPSLSLSSLASIDRRRAERWLPWSCPGHCSRV